MSPLSKPINGSTTPNGGYLDWPRQTFDIVYSLFGGPGRE